MHDGSAKARDNYRFFFNWTVASHRPSDQLKPLAQKIFEGRGFSGCGKTQTAVILSEAKNLYWFLLYASIEERFFASLRMTA
jgi:hypothetical protein